MLGTSFDINRKNIIPLTNLHRIFEVSSIKILIARDINYFFSEIKMERKFLASENLEQAAFKEGYVLKFLYVNALNGSLELHTDVNDFVNMYLF